MKLLKKDKKKNAFIGVAHGITDCEGFYQFDICGCDETGSFKIVVSKAASGKERVICDKGECEPCDKFDKED